MNDTLGELERENELLREEVRVARDAANITAEAVVAQFAETERVLGRLQEVGAQRQAVLDAASKVSVVATDAAGVVRLFNTGAEALLGYRAEEIVGRATPAAFHVTEELETAAAALFRESGRQTEGLGVLFAYADLGRVEVKEWTLVRKDESRVPVDLSVSALRGPSGETNGILCVALDLTERKRAEAEIQAALEATEAAHRTKSAFLATMSHELRTPLNAIIGYSEMVMEELHDRGDEDLAADVQKIRSAGQHLAALINDVLDMSKIEAGRIELLIESVDVRELVTEVALTAQPLITQRGNVLELECEGVGEMNADPLRLRQVLLNLVSNAAKFTKAGKVTLRATVEPGESGDVIAFEVEDTGIGMTADQLARLFKPFVQADASTTRQYGGTGLGLAISKQLCELMGGTIGVESEPGRGTTFTARLPRVVERRPSLRPPPAAIVPRPVRERPPTNPPRSRASGTVLVVDDDPIARDLIARYLEREGYRVLPAASGSEGLGKAREARPDVITLDVLMPGKDGWSVLAELKGDPATADIPVVMLTMLDQRSAGYALGAADYLMKPIDRSRLLAVVARHRRAGVATSVLVVEDDEDMQGLMRQTLEREGCRVRVAGNGQEGLDRVAEEVPALILLDLLMPVMDGFKFLEILRARPEWRAIPVVVVTAAELAERERSEISLQVERIVQKGATARDALLAEVRRLLDLALQR